MYAYSRANIIPFMLIPYLLPNRVALIGACTAAERSTFSPLRTLPVNERNSTSITAIYTIFTPQNTSTS